eukprot:5780099-Alexandrium_andersonii.AAC.1
MHYQDICNTNLFNLTVGRADGTRARPPQERSRAETAAPASSRGAGRSPSREHPRGRKRSPATRAALSSRGSDGRDDSREARR